MAGGRLTASAYADEWRVYDRPGVHSYNAERKLRAANLGAARRNKRGLAWARRALFLLGMTGICIYGYSVAQESIYQAYANWAFDQEIAGRSATFFDYLRRLTGIKRVPDSPTAGRPTTPARIERLTPGELVGRVRIPRLNLSAVVLEGVDDATLRRSAGHVPSTALPGDVGNFSIAAHRDTLFRPLKDIRPGDEVQFSTPQKDLVFRVVSTRIVMPTDVSVLAPQGDQRLLTMITCYPFYYVGSAPQRFIVTARLEPQAAVPESHRPRI